MNINKRLGRALVACAGALILVVSMAAPAQAAPPPGKGPQTQEQCVQTATTVKYQEWLCLGGELRVQRDEHGKPVDLPEQAQAPQSAGTGPAITTASYRLSSSSRTLTVTGDAKGFRVVPARGGDYFDTWCEPSGVCPFRVSDYQARVKGNVVYGNSNGVVGTFDVIVTTYLNGRQQQWSASFRWDSGGGFSILLPTVQCRQWWGVGSISCGNHGMNGAYLSGSSYSYNASRVNGNYLSNRGDYFGKFITNIDPDSMPILTVPGLDTKTLNCPTAPAYCRFP